MTMYIYIHKHMHIYIQNFPTWLLPELAQRVMDAQAGDTPTIKKL